MLNKVDMVILAVVIFFFCRGLYRGFFKEMASLAGVILGIWLGNQYYPRLAEFLKSWLPLEAYLPWIAFGLIFFAVILCFHVIGVWLKKIFQKVFLGWADRLVGGVLALLKGVLILYLALVALTILAPSQARTVADSRLAPLVVRSYQFVAQSMTHVPYSGWKERLMEQKGKLEDLF